jgi:SpoVK/Ycf46/Vps4 family AAA+-type ATPase
VSGPLPPGMSLEKPARNLAALAATSSLGELRGTVLAQWGRRKQFSALVKYGIQPINLALFHGPPGNGKTMACGWLAEKLGVSLYRVRCESLVGSHLGATASNFSNMMAWLAQQKSPCVVLFDEVEQILPSRGTGNTADGCRREIASAMTVFWQWIDRWEAETLFVLATNLPAALDAALLSRCELKLEFGPPTPEQASNVIAYWRETLHEFGSDTWGPQLAEVARWESFRELFFAVQSAVRKHVAAQPG